jgi:predicted metal-dependent phosphoesterase TrpH
MSNRRDFLKRSALFGAAAAFAPVSNSFGANAKNKKTPPQPVAVPEDTYTVNLGYIYKTRGIPARKITIPDVEGFKVLKGDFHIHTLFSDGSVMPRDRVTEAVQNGLDVIAITDHLERRRYICKDGLWKLAAPQADDSNIWYDAAKAEADKRNLLLIRGGEMTKTKMPPGHFNLLFTTDNNPIMAAQVDWKEMLQVAADQGAFLLWNHPGWENQIGQGGALRFTEAHEEVYKRGLMHGIEIFNTNEYYPIVSDWCNERDLALFANSDIHPSELNEYGIQNPLRPITLVLAQERTLESIKEAFFAKRTIAWAADMIWGRDPWLPALFKASVEISNITPGVLQLLNKSSLPIFITVGGVVIDLPHNVKRQVHIAGGVKALTVTNWMIGMNKPLEIAL